MKTCAGFKPPDPADPHSTNIVLNALAVSGYRPKKLQLGSYSWSLPLSSFPLRGTNALNARQAFENLREFDLHVWCLSDWYDEDDEADYCQGLAILITGAHQLEKLSIAIETHRAGLPSGD